MIQRKFGITIAAILLFLTSYILTRHFSPLNSRITNIESSYDLDWTSGILSWVNFFDNEDENTTSEYSTTKGMSQSAANPEVYDPSTLGVASHIFVVSLARRSDRRSRMEVLRKAMHLRWSYVNAMEKDDPRVSRIMDSVRRERSAYNASRDLTWPDRSENFNFLGPRLVDYWPLDVGPPNASSISNSTSAEVDPLFCAVGENIVPKYKKLSKVPYHLILSRGMVACWYSHLSVIRKIAELGSTDSETGSTRNQSATNRDVTAIVLEDDVDMEWDIYQRLTSMWPQLPEDWDIVLLGKFHLSLIAKLQ